MEAIRFSIRVDRITLSADFKEIDIESATVQANRLELFCGVDVSSYSDSERMLAIAHTLQEVASEVLAGIQLVAGR